MLDFQQKRKVRSVMYNRITLGVLFVVVLFVLHSTWSVYQKKRESEKIKNITLAHVEELRARDQELVTKLERLDSEVGVEEEIRSKYNVAKVGENIVVVVPEKNSTTTSDKNSKNFWHIIKGFFGAN